MVWVRDEGIGRGYKKHLKTSGVTGFSNAFFYEWAMLAKKITSGKTI